MEKDSNRFSFSRLQTFKQCPLKHHYSYFEKIEVPEGITTIPGSLFHRCMQKIFDPEKPVDYTNFKEVNAALVEEYKEFDAQSTELDMKPGTLRDVVLGYLNYYRNDYAKERILRTEQEFEEVLDPENFPDERFVLIIDQIFELGTLIGIRDFKTRSRALKYTQDEVTYNEQLLLYVPFAEAMLNVKIDFIQIDEVRFAALQPVPILQSGRPTMDKRQLELVTYEAYYEALEERGIEDDPKFQAILDYLRQRGHPLYNRISAHIMDRTVIDQNIKDLYNVYLASKTKHIYRVKGPLCNYCAYKELCLLDYHNPSEVDRDIIKEKIK